MRKNPSRHMGRWRSAVAIPMRNLSPFSIAISRGFCVFSIFHRAAAPVCFQSVGKLPLSLFQFIFSSSSSCFLFSVGQEITQHRIEDRIVAVRGASDAVYATVWKTGAMADVVEGTSPFCITTQCFFYFLFLFDICRRGKRRERKTREEKCNDPTLFCINCRLFAHPSTRFNFYKIYLKSLYLFFLVET